MAKSKTITDQDFGEIKLTKYKGAKYIKIKVSQDAVVSMSLPFYVRFDEAIGFIEEKRDWIHEELLKLKSHKEQLQLIKPEAFINIPEETPELVTAPLETDFATKFRKLELIPCEVSKPTYRISPSKIKVYYPRTMKPKDEAIENTIKEAIEKTLKREAHNYLPRRLQELAEKHQLQYKKLAIRNTKTRWGSCTHENNINLATHLMKLPDELIDYVILHELTHTVEKNHSARFWEFLSKLLETDAKTVDKKLKSYSTDLILV